MRGFTLVEILVVIGIIVVLAGILVPMIGRAMRQAKRTRTAADMQAITTALEQFKNDTGDYPRWDAGPNIGAAILGRYLNGPLGDGYKDGVVPPAPMNDDKDPAAHNGAATYLPGDVVTDGTIPNTFVAVKPSTGVTPGSDPKTWVPYNNLRDGLDGQGIRFGSGQKKLGPYITNEKLKMQGICFLDTFGSPILYFPASTAKINLLDASSSGAYVNRVSTASPVPTHGASKASIKYDADDNFEAFRRDALEADANVLHRIRAMLGDYNGNGVIDTANSEKIVTEAPFLLWSAGPDGLYGPDAAAVRDFGVLDVLDVDKCDDVVNFK